MFLPEAFLQLWKQPWPSDKREARNSREEVPLEELPAPVAHGWRWINTLPALPLVEGWFWDMFTIRLSSCSPTAAICLAHPVGVRPSLLCLTGPCLYVCFPESPPEWITCAQSLGSHFWRLKTQTMINGIKKSGNWKHWWERRNPNCQPRDSVWLNQEQKKEDMQKARDSWEVKRVEVFVRKDTGV